MLDAFRYRYGVEKLYNLVRYAATAAGDARARLAGCYSELVVLREEHVPSDAWPKIVAARKRLEQGDGTVEQSVRRMKNSTAAQLLSGLWEAYELSERAFEADTTK